MAALMRQCGASEEQIAQARQERGGADAPAADVVEVWPENWSTWQFFLLVQTQWLFAPMGLSGAVRVALNYPGVESIARMRRVGADELAHFVDGLGVIELAVLAVDRDAAQRAVASGNKGRKR